MLRASMIELFALVPIVFGNFVAAPNADEHGSKHCQGTITKIDAQNSSIGIRTMKKDKDGKEQDKTLQLSKDAKLLDANGKESKLDTFKVGDEVCVTEKDNKVVQLRKHAEATITKVDEKAGTITVKMMDKTGKETERTFKLIEDAEYIDSTGRIAVLDVFQSGDDILFVEADGKITGMKKVDQNKNATAAKESKEKVGK